MDIFHYDLEFKLVFAKWYNRYKKLFEVDAKSICDPPKVRLLMRKLVTMAHICGRIQICK